MKSRLRVRQQLHVVLILGLLLSLADLPAFATPRVGAPNDTAISAANREALARAAAVARSGSTRTPTVAVDQPALAAAPAAVLAASAAPTASITAPAANTTVAGTVTVTADAADDGGVTLVEFYFDGVRFADDNIAPYSVSWNTKNSALPAYDGVYALTTRAYDAEGQVTTSAPVSVTVANTAGTPYQATFSSSIVPLVTGYDPVATTQQTQGVDVTITNTSSSTWRGSEYWLTSTWYSPDTTPVAVRTTQISIGADLRSGQSRTIRVQVAPPTLVEGVNRAQYKLQFDLYREFTGCTTGGVSSQPAQLADQTDQAAGDRSAAASGAAPSCALVVQMVDFSAKGNRPLNNPIIVNKTLMDEALGLERYYHYVGEDVGAGMQQLLNIANGNTLLRWTPFQAPGRGLATVVDLTYNSLEKKSESPAGNNFSLSISGLTRLGLPLDIHPNNADTIAGRANRWIGFTDGDGTTHRFTGQLHADGTVYWQEPPGVNLYLRSFSTTDPTRAWAITRPDRVTFFFDSDGYPTSVEDANGNRITYTLETIQPGEDPGGPKKRITAVTDAAGQGATPAPNRRFTIDYYSKAEAKKPQVRGRIQRLTDHTGSALDFEYYEDGNLLRITQRGGVKADGSALADRSFVFTYTTANGDGPAIADPALRVNPDPKATNQSVYLYSVRDPRGLETRYSYYGPGSTQDRWKLQTRTDRLDVVTSFAYDITNRITTVTAPLSRVSAYAYDTDGKVTTITNPLNQATQVAWSADRKVTRVTEPTGQYSEFAYNSNGYLTDRWDQLRNRTTLTYQNIAVDSNDVSGKWAAGHTIPHISQLVAKTEPRGMATASPTDDYQWSFTYDAKGNLLTAVDPVQKALGKATTYAYNADGAVRTMTDANSRVTTYVSYDANGLPTTITDAKGQTTTFGYDDDGLLRWVQDPIHAAASTGDPRGFRSYFDYDSFHRLGRQSAPKSTSAAAGALIWSGADYDANDNQTLQIGPHYGANYADQGGGARTTMSYDGMDRRTLMTGPDTTVDPAGERTAYQYDAAGRMTRMTQPKGVQSASTDLDFAEFRAYDALDRMVKQYRHAVNSSGAITETRYTHLCYDLAGDLRSVTSPNANVSSVDCAAPPSYTAKYEYDAAHKRTAEIDPLGNRQTTTYDANDNRATQVNAHGHTTSYEYDQRDQLVKTIQPFVTATGLAYVMPPTSYTDARPRTLTTKYEYDAVGNRARQISPRGWDASSDKTNFSDYVTSYTYDEVNQLVRIELPSESAERTAGKTQYIHRAYDANGRMAWSSQPVTNAAASAVPADQKTTQEYWDPGWIRTSQQGQAAKTFFDYTAEGWQSSRTPAIPSGQTNAGQPNTNKRVTWTYYVDGQLREQKAQQDLNGGATTYSYDANNNQTTIRATGGLKANDPKESPMTVENTYDGFDAVIKTRQKKDRETVWKVSTSSYDKNGNVLDQVDDAEEGSTDPNKQGHKQHFDFNVGDRLTQQIDYGAKSATDDDQRITYTYLPEGWEQQRVVAKSNGAGGWTTKQTVDREFYATGQMYKQTTKDAGGNVTESHTVSYTDALNRYADGNQTKDSFSLKGPAGQPTSCETTCNASYSYDARGRLTGTQDGYGGSIDYTLDPAGNITNENNSRTGSRSYTYSSNQLQTMTAGGSTQNYFYDDEGNLDCVTTAAGTQANCPSQPGSTLPSNVVQDYTYDYEQRVTSYRGATTGMQQGSSADYGYDALGRMSEESESHASGAARTTQFSYEGLSDRVSTETLSGTGAGTKSYSYDAFGEKAGMTNTPSGGAAERYSYGYDARGNISQLLNESGGAKAAYGYQPYGAQADGLSKGDSNAQSPLNPYRFTGKRYDSGSGNLQMGARQFGPQMGRFVQPDRYQGALADLGLSMDPLTQNRMSLAGSNPINFVEVDGHFSLRDIGSSIKDAVTSDTAHTALDACGLVFDACDVANAASYALEGDWKNAATSAAGAIPGIGAAATGAKWAAKGAKAASGVGAAATAGKYSDEAAGAVKAMCSFSADTPVATADGDEPIAQLDVGDEVLAYDEASGETGRFPVQAVLVHLDRAIVRLTIDDEQLETTPEHPFFSEQRGWTPAAALRVGEPIRRADGSAGAVAALSIEHRPQVMYNLTVGVAHTFFVGDGEWLVHNDCGSTSKRLQYLGRTPGKNSRTGREVIERMEGQGRIRGSGDQREVFHEGSQQWHPINETDMGHTQDAVSWWNKQGRQYGAKSPEVRRWMLDSSNYELEPSSINRSRGASLTETYLDPLE
jgi:RHS repeat-associated protein